MPAEDRINVIISAQAEDLRRALRESTGEVKVLDKSLRDVKNKVSVDFDIKTAPAELRLKALDETVRKSTREIERDKEFGLDTGVAEAKLALLRREADRTKRDIAHAQLGSSLFGPLFSGAGGAGGGAGGLIGGAGSGGGSLGSTGGLGAGALAAGSLPAAAIITALLGSATAVTGSAGAGILGAGALGVGGLGAGLVGGAGFAAVLIPTIQRLKDAEKAQKAFDKAVSVYGEHSKQAETAQKKLNAALAGLGGGEVAKAFKSLDGLGDTFQKLTKPAQKQIGGIFADAVKTAKSVLPTFAGVANNATKGVADALKPIFATLRGANFKGILTDLGKLFQQLGKPIGRGIADVIRIIGQIARASAPFVLQFARGIASFLDNVARRTGNTKALQGVIGGLVAQFRSWLGLAGSVGRLLVTIFSAGAGQGKGLVDTLTKIVDGWNKWLNTKAGQDALRKFFNDSIALVKQLVTTLAPLVAAFLKLAIDLIPRVTELLKLLAPIIRIVVGAMDLFIEANKSADAIVAKAWNHIKDIFNTIAPFIRGLAAGVSDAFHSVFDPVVNIVAGVINSIIDILNKIPGVNIGHVNEAHGGSALAGAGGKGSKINTGGSPTARATGGMMVDHPMFIVGEEAPTHPEVVIATNPQYRQRNVGLWAEAGKRLGVPGFAAGGVVGGAASDIAGGVVGAAGDALSALLPKNPGGPIAGPAINVALNAAKNFILGHTGGGGASAKGLQPIVLAALAWARSHGWHGSITSGFRSFAEQAAIHASGVFFAAPGHSMHERGLAVDVTDIAGFQAAMNSAPPGAKLYNRLGAIDPEHFSTTGYARGGWVVRALASGGPLVVTGPVSTFGPPGEGAGGTAYGKSSADAGIALNPHGGGNWNDALARSLQGRWFDVGVGAHHAKLQVIDKGPSAWGRRGPRKIDITGAGARRMGLNPSAFPTDATGKAIEIGARGSLDPTADLVVKYDQRTGAKVTHSKKYWDHMRRLHPDAYSHYKSTPPKKKKPAGTATAPVSSWIEQYAQIPQDFYAPFDYAFNKAELTGDIPGELKALEGRFAADNKMIGTDEAALAFYLGIKAQGYRWGNTPQDRGYVNGAIGQLQGILSGLYQDLKGTIDQANALKAQPAAPGTSAADTGLAGLLQQQLDNALRALALSEGQGGALQGFSGLLGGRLLGSFARGGVTTGEGWAYVHPNEAMTVQPDPQGPYGSTIMQNNTGSGKPPQVHVFIDGEPGALTKSIRAEIDGYAAPVVSRQLGARQRRIAGVRG